MHGCIGAPLARLEAKIALEEALPRSATTRSRRRPVRYRTTPNMYVWEHLHAGVPGRRAARAAAARRDRAAPHDHMTVLTRELEADVRVEAKDEVADGVVALTLRAVDGQPAAAVDARRARRPDPGRGADPAVLAVRRPGRPPRRSGSASCATPNGGGGSRSTSTTGCGAGDVVRVRGPRNNFALVASPRYLFIAGGIGITPILPMIAAAEAAGADWRLVYGGRQRASMAFLRRARAVRRPGHRLRRRTRPGCSTSTACSARRRPDTLVYCCGPEPLLAAVEERCARLAARVAARRAVRARSR